MPSWIRPGSPQRGGPAKESLRLFGALGDRKLLEAVNLLEIMKTRLLRATDARLFARTRSLRLLQEASLVEGKRVGLSVRHHFAGDGVNECARLIFSAGGCSLLGTHLQETLGQGKEF